VNIARCFGCSDVRFFTCHARTYHTRNSANKACNSARNVVTSIAEVWLMGRIVPQVELAGALKRVLSDPDCLRSICTHFRYPWHIPSAHQRRFLHELSGRRSHEVESSKTDSMRKGSDSRRTGVARVGVLASGSVPERSLAHPIAPPQNSRVGAQSPASSRPKLAARYLHPSAPPAAVRHLHAALSPVLTGRGGVRGACRVVSCRGGQLELPAGRAAVPGHGGVVGHRLRGGGGGVPRPHAPPADHRGPAAAPPRFCAARLPSVWREQGAG
jgi:hypothetical protein